MKTKLHARSFNDFTPYSYTSTDYYSKPTKQQIKLIYKLQKKIYGRTYKLSKKLTRYYAQKKIDNLLLKLNKMKGHSFSEPSPTESDFVKSKSKSNQNQIKIKSKSK